MFVKQGNKIVWCIMSLLYYKLKERVRSQVKIKINNSKYIKEYRFEKREQGFSVFRDFQELQRNSFKNKRQRIK